MRIAYIANYQGPTLLRRRPIVINRTMAGTIKIEVIAALLRDSGHEVEILAQGEVVETAWKYYPGFEEEERFHPGIPVTYASALPVRRVNGAWSNYKMLELFKARQGAAPYDLVIIYNLKTPQIACADYAIHRLKLPVILEYEDDRFVDVQGEAVNSFSMRRDARASMKLFQSVSGGTAVSPHLLAQLPADIPKLLLRGVVGPDVVAASAESRGAKKTIVLFSGTHTKSNGIAQLIEAWRSIELPGWELHITGEGVLTPELRKMAAGVAGVTFHGLVSRPELVRLMCSARVCVNPHQVSKTPGNVFAFKLVEYLSAGAHVVSTPMGPIEKELEAGMTYMQDNTPETIAATIQQVIRERAYERNAMKAAQVTYGPGAVSKALNDLIDQVMHTAGKKNWAPAELAATAQEATR